MSIILSVNGSMHEVAVGSDVPLLYVLRNDLRLNGPKFGCGMGQCGACTILLDGEATRSCVLSVGAVGEGKIQTLDGMKTDERLHPLQAAFLAEQAAQCGYCTNGMIMGAKALLDRNPRPTETAVREELSNYLCRCGVQNRIVRAVLRAAEGTTR